MWLETLAKVSNEAEYGMVDTFKVRAHNRSDKAQDETKLQILFDTTFSSLVLQVFTFGLTAIMNFRKRK